MCRPALRLEQSDDEARIGARPCPFRLGDDAPAARPAVFRRPQKVAEDAGSLAAGFGLKARLLQGLSDLLFQPLVAGKAKDIVDGIALAPGHQFVAGKTGIGAQDDAHGRPALPDLPDDAIDFLDGALAGIDVGAPQLGRKQMPAAEDIERQIAVDAVMGRRLRDCRQTGGCPSE